MSTKSSLKNCATNILFVLSLPVMLTASLFLCAVAIIASPFYSLSMFFKKKATNSLDLTSNHNIYSFNGTKATRVTDPNEIARTAQKIQHYENLISRRFSSFNRLPHVGNEPAITIDNTPRRSRS